MGYQKNKTVRQDTKCNQIKFKTSCDYMSCI